MEIKMTCNNCINRSKWLGNITNTCDNCIAYEKWEPDYTTSYAMNINGIYAGRNPKMTTNYHLYKNHYDIEKVIFNNPATIVLWKDGTKTVVKTQGEKFDPEKGLAMAISKKALGNQGNYYEIFKKWVREEEEEEEVVTVYFDGSSFEESVKRANKAIKKATESIRKAVNLYDSNKAETDGD